MDLVLFERLDLKPDSQYFIYIGEIKAIGLNHFYKQALSRFYGPKVDCISVVPDQLQVYPEENLLVINHDATCLQTETDKNVSMRIPGKDFAAMVNRNSRFRRLMDELKPRQGQVPIWMFENRSEFEYCSDDHVLLLGPRPELAKKFNNKVWQYRHLSQVVPMPPYRICQGEEALKKGLHEIGLEAGKSVFVTREFGAAGVGSGVVCDIADLDPCLGKPDEVYVASCFIPHEWDPTVLAVVANEHDVYVAGVADMTIEGENKFRGSHFPSRLSVGIQAKLVEYTRQVGRMIGRLGYRGIFGCDFLVDDHSEVYFIEVNARKQGTTMEYCCALEQILPAGAPNLPELEYWAVTRDCFPKETVEPTLGQSPFWWGTYNFKVEQMVQTTTMLAQERTERNLFRSVSQGKPPGHIILEHPGAGVHAMSGSFLARAIAVGHEFEEMRNELDKARQAIKASFTPLGN